MMKSMAVKGPLICSSFDIDLVNERRPWSDDLLSKIASEELAREAFEKSSQLQAEFPSCGAFTGYWGALRRGQVKIIQGRK
jgi:hypothetical protein